MRKCNVNLLFGNKIFEKLEKAVKPNPYWEKVASFPNISQLKEETYPDFLIKRYSLNSLSPTFH